jgi:hypothetical protein
MKLFLSFFNIFIFVFFSTVSAKDANKDISETIEKIPHEDREKLERFFWDLIVCNHFGYTLYGDKPISLNGYFCKTPLGNILCGQLPVDEFPQLLSVWKKYASNFPSSKFLLIDEPQSNPDMREFVIINKTAFIKTINKNIVYFKKVLGDNVSGRKLLNQLKQPDANLHTVLHNHEGLLGILLGYGTRNAFLYHQRDKILHNVRMEKVPLNLYASDKSTLNADKKKKLKYLWAHLKSCGEHDYSPLTIGSVHFVGDLSNHETIALMKKYQKTRGHLSSLYADGCFLHRTLMQLISK